MKQLIQENCLKVLNSYYPFIQTVVFNKTVVNLSISNSHLIYERNFR